MSKKKARNQEKAQETVKFTPEPWIKMRTGLIIVAIASLGMAVLTFIQVLPSEGWWKALLWGLFFGGLIWAVFWGMYFFRKIFK